jgi:homoserine O-acetyltransferase
LQTQAADYPAPKQGDWIAWDFKTLAPTAAKADKMVDERRALPVIADANDFVYQWEASHDYNPSPGLERIKATLLAINAADDERNPPETGVTDAAMKRIKNGKLYVIPASTETRGHLTPGNAKFYRQQLLLATAPQRTM